MDLLCCNLSGTDLVIADNRSNRILTYDATDITNPILQDEFRWNLQTSSIDFDGENLILNNWVNGITELDWNQFLSVNELPIINKDIFLTNFPNPFNPETKISFSVTQNSDFVNLDIYNIRGQKVDQLEITNYELGINEVTWDAKKFASGIYMYQLKVDGKAIASKKCLLLK
ncbi:MAG: T9SS type A sorting domain-containing protein [Candidatus Tenebribacter davisii]|nr:T9SS type A sorting domain-containing protein [Candidatus Tenebribacter davisii]